MIFKKSLAFEKKEISFEIWQQKYHKFAIFGCSQRKPSRYFPKGAGIFVIESKILPNFEKKGWNFFQNYIKGEKGGFKNLVNCRETFFFLKYDLIICTIWRPNYKFGLWFFKNFVVVEKNLKTGEGISDE